MFFSFYLKNIHCQRDSRSRNRNYRYLLALIELHDQNILVLLLQELELTVIHRAELRYDFSDLILDLVFLLEKKENWDIVHHYFYKGNHTGAFIPNESRDESWIKGHFFETALNRKSINGFSLYITVESWKVMNIWSIGRPCVFSRCFSLILLVGVPKYSKEDSFESYWSNPGKK